MNPYTNSQNYIPLWNIYPTSSWFTHHYGLTLRARFTHLVYALVYAPVYTPNVELVYEQLMEFVIEDLSRMTRHVLMTWIEKKNKKMSTSRVYDEFDQMFSHLPSIEQALLEEEKTLYFLKSVDMRDRRELGVHSSKMTPKQTSL